MVSTVVLLSFYLVFSEALQEGDQCVKDGVVGICTNLSQCKSAIADVNNGKNPQICAFTEPTILIVCCFAGEEDVDRSLGAVSSEGQSDEGADPSLVCPDIPPSMTTKKTGRKAFDKCIEYQSKYVYPCERTVALIEGMDRNYHCHHSAVKLIYGGTNAAQHEFPHMVLIGFGPSSDNSRWMCNGAIISEKYILSTVRCFVIAPRPMDNIYARIGLYKLTDTEDNSKIYPVKDVIIHPDYKNPRNDISLLRMETEMVLDQYTVPACLHTGEAVNDEQVLAIGWGRTATSQYSDYLQKVILTKFSSEECSEQFQPTSSKPGFDNLTQTCYGDKVVSKETCVGDSGVPIQIKSNLIDCMYTIVGIQSFGKIPCGVVGQASVFTRVAQFIPWIESIVWPN